MYGTTLENRQYLVIVENLRKQAPVNRTKHRSRVQLLMNDLSFNLCVVPWSLVVKLVAYFGIRVSQQSRGPRDTGQEQKWIRIGLGPNDVNLQTKELYCNYIVLIGSLEQEESSLLCYPTIINFRRIIRRNKLHNYHISGI